MLNEKCPVIKTLQSIFEWIYFSRIPIFALPSLYFFCQFIFIIVLGLNICQMYCIIIQIKIKHISLVLLIHFHFNLKVTNGAFINDVIQVRGEGFVIVCHKYISQSTWECDRGERGKKIKFVWRHLWMISHISNGWAVVLYPGNPGSNPGGG